MADAALSAGSRMVVPYITPWTGEREPDFKVVERRSGGIGYARESVLDRDELGVLWSRLSSAPGRGRPAWGDVHPMRQRRAMARLLCQVCTEPADRNADGVLWLWKDHRDHWRGWPEDMWMPEPPVCRSCARLAVRLCPSLRPGAVAIRSGECPVIGVSGLVFQPDRRGPVPTRHTNVPYDSPMAQWVLADKLLRALHDTVLVPMEELAD